MGDIDLVLEVTRNLPRPEKPNHISKVAQSQPARETSQQGGILDLHYAYRVDALALEATSDIWRGIRCRKQDDLVGRSSAE